MGGGRGVCMGGWVGVRGESVYGWVGRCLGGGGVHGGVCVYMWTFYAKWALIKPVHGLCCVACSPAICSLTQPLFGSKWMEVHAQRAHGPTPHPCPCACTACAWTHPSPMSLCMCRYGPGEGYALNVPLDVGMDDESYKFMFEPIMQKVRACVCVCVRARVLNPSCRRCLCGRVGGGEWGGMQHEPMHTARCGCPFPPPMPSHMPPPPTPPPTPPLCWHR